MDRGIHGKVTSVLEQCTLLAPCCAETFLGCIKSALFFRVMKWKKNFMSHEGEERREVYAPVDEEIMIIFILIIEAFRFVGKAWTQVLTGY